MRPRPKDRGELRSRCRTRPRTSLQCGHGPKTVENHEVHCPSATWRIRGFNAATAQRPWRTIRSSCASWPKWHASMRPRPKDRGEPHDRLKDDSEPLQRFNAATAQRPWRTTARYPRHQHQHGLQCGHGPKTVENRPPSARAWPVSQASMRPRPKDRGEPSAATVCGSGSTARFNAATVMRPWRT